MESNSGASEPPSPSPSQSLTPTPSPSPSQSPSQSPSPSPSPSLSPSPSPSESTTSGSPSDSASESNVAVVRPSNRYVPWHHGRIFDEDRELLPTRRIPIELPSLKSRGGIEDLAEELVHEQPKPGFHNRAIKNKQSFFDEWISPEETDSYNWNLSVSLKGTTWGNLNPGEGDIGEDAFEQWQSLDVVRAGIERYSRARQRERTEPEPEHEFIGIPLVFNTTEVYIKQCKTQINQQTRDPYYENTTLPHRHDYQPRVPRSNRQRIPQLVFQKEPEIAIPDDEPHHISTIDVPTGPRLSKHIHQAELNRMNEEIYRDHSEAAAPATPAGEAESDPFATYSDDDMYNFDYRPVRPYSILDLATGSPRFFPQSRETKNPQHGASTTFTPANRGRKRKSTCAPREVVKRRAYKWKDGVAPQRRLGHVKYPKGHIYHNLPKRGEFVIPEAVPQGTATANVEEEQEVPESSHGNNRNDSVDFDYDEDEDDDVSVNYSELDGDDGDDGDDDY